MDRFSAAAFVWAEVVSIKPISPCIESIKAFMLKSWDWFKSVSPSFKQIFLFIFNLQFISKSNEGNWGAGIASYLYMLLLTVGAVIYNVIVIPLSIIGIFVSNKRNSKKGKIYFVSIIFLSIVVPLILWLIFPNLHH